MKSKSRLTTTKWKCAHCEKEFKYDSERRRHEQSHVPQFECKVCSKRFSFVSALRRHEKQHERTGSVECKECGGKFRDETLLKRHIQYAHKGTYTCKKCSTTFNSESALRTHMKIHQPESERRYRCSFEGCQKTFNFPHHLKHHQLTHTDDKQYFCDVCDKGFIQLHHLKIHLKTHEPDSWLPCTVPNCKKRFVNEYARKRHLATHKNKTDGGILSDSRITCDGALPRKTEKDTDLCVSCGKIISRRYYDKHALKCNKRKDQVKTKDLSSPRLKVTPVISTSKNITEAVEMELDKGAEIDEINDNVDIDKVNNDQLDKVDKDIATDNVDSTISTCKAVLGGCIVSGNSEINSNCLCAQMTTTVDDYYYLVPKENDNSFNSNLVPKEIDNNFNSNLVPKEIDNNFNSNLVPKEIDNNFNSNDVVSNTNICNDINNLKTIVSIQNSKLDDITETDMCQGCECSKTCSINRDIIEENNQMPQIEYRTDGTVKIKEIFDMDIDFNVKTDLKNETSKLDVRVNCNREPTDLKYVTFNSCKDILGNCIVSGNSTIGEGCLCAKMSMDNQQIIAQEIEDITPCPKNTWL